MMAIIATIPLWATLWLLEWTQRIAMVVVDLLIGLMIAGLVAAITFAILATTPLGALAFIIDPIAMYREFLQSSILRFPGEQMLGTFKKNKNQGTNEGNGSSSSSTESNGLSESPAGMYM
ncbi:conjugal transfer protein [Acidianus ambivalens]|uniref:conjugal transfer protein n=1 Tax=Acidianus ambivalens TaxID=2283 RepID=UPI001E2A8B96|nr:conjugal transfer protein [Acidianus ambivalens]